MDISDVRKRVHAAIDRAKQRDADRRARVDAGGRAYSAFLETIAVPLFRQLANILRAEGYLFTVFTPSGAVKLVADRDSIELVLDTAGDEPRVVAHTTRARGRRVTESERVVGDPAALTEDDVLVFVLAELEGLISR